MGESSLTTPDALIRLVSVIHRLGCPEIGKERRISFTESFKSSGMPHSNTRLVLIDADECRNALSSSLFSMKNSATASEIVLRNSEKYKPLISQILLSCKVQPDSALLDKHLMFEWASGLSGRKAKARFYTSEALMFDLVMTISCEALSNANLGCDNCASGDFINANRNFKTSATIFQFLADDQLPKWISKGSSMKEENLPCEATIGVCDALSLFFLGVAQQMAIATVLKKPDTPNYSLLAKLSLGIAEQFESFMHILRSKASHAISRIDEIFFTVVTFQTSLQRALSNYFLARSCWNDASYGVGIAFLKEAIAGMKTRDSPVSKGLPSLKSLNVLQKDVNQFKDHLSTLLKSWERDNSLVYFEAVPRVIPEAKRLSKGIMMMKFGEYTLAEVDPFPLGLKVADISGDEKMARMLQRQYDQE